MPVQEPNGNRPYDHSLTAAMKSSALGALGNLVEGIARIGEDGGDYLERKIPLSGLSEEELQQHQLEMLFRAADWFKRQQEAVNYQPTVNFDQVKDDLLNLPQTGRFIVEQGADAIPGMIVGAVSPAAEVIANINEIASNRAENDNRKNNVTLGDMLKAAPGAVAESVAGAALGRVMPRKPPSSSVLARIGSQAMRQAGAQAFDGVASYGAQTIGTQKGFDPTDALDEALEGVLVGASTGGFTRSAGDVGNALHARLSQAMRDRGGRGRK